MGKKKDLRRALAKAEAHPFSPPVPLAKPHPDDDKLVQISTFITSGDRYRLKTLGLRLDNTSLQRLGHRAWNALLASHGQPGLKPVLQGARGREAGDEGSPVGERT